MTICPICRAREGLVDECICQNGLIDETLLRHTPIRWHDNAWLLGWVTIGLTIWGAGIWRAFL